MLHRQKFHASSVAAYIIEQVRFLSIDIGDKRTGLALGDDETGVVSPLGVLKTDGGPLVTAIVKAIDEHGPDAIVLGLPLNMDGSEGPAARNARELGGQLDQQTDRPVYYQDERLTTFAADQQLAGSGKTHKAKKELRDALAAAEILRDFLAARK